MSTHYSFTAKSNHEDVMLVTTNSRLVQLITLVLSFAIVFPSQFAIAAPSTSFQLAMEAKDAKKWKKALSLFASVSESDPDYGRALDEIALINDLQKSDSEAHKTRYKAERLIERLDRGADKCVGLLKRDGSPEVHGCFEEMSKVEGEVSEMLRNTNYEHPTLKDLDKQLVPFRKFDEIALPVTKVRPSRDEMEQATEKVLALERYIQDQNNPPNLVALGAFVLSQFHLGGARAHAKDCARLRSDPETRDTQATADICGFAEEASMKYGDFVRRLDSSNLIDGPSIPSIAYKAVAPIKSDKLPRPEVVSVLVAAPKADSKIPQDLQSSWTTTLVLGGVSVAAAVLGTVFLMKRPAKTTQQSAVQPAASADVVQQQQTSGPTTTTTSAVTSQPAPVNEQSDANSNGVETSKAPGSAKVAEVPANVHSDAPLASPGSPNVVKDKGGEGQSSTGKDIEALKKRIAQLKVNKENSGEPQVPKASGTSPETRGALSAKSPLEEATRVSARKNAAAPAPGERGYVVPLVAKSRNPIPVFEAELMKWSRREGSFAVLQRLAEEQGVTLVKDNPRATTYALTATVRPDASDIAKQMAEMANIARMTKVGVK